MPPLPQQRAGGVLAREGEAVVAKAERPSFVVVDKSGVALATFRNSTSIS
jgi:hypothetical protein